MQLLIRIPDRVRHLAIRLADIIPPTWRGLMVAVLAALALWQWGYREMDLVLFVVGLAGLVLLALASIVVAGAAAFLTRRLENGSEGRLDLETEAPASTGFRIPALGRLPLLEIDWHWQDPPEAECRQQLQGGHLEETIVAHRRGLGTSIQREITLRDAFGLTRIAWQRRDPRPVRVLPNRGRLRSMPRVVSMSSAEGLPYPSGSPEGDRMEIRRYVPGDSARHILWKTYARTRQLNVRVPERAIDRTERTVAYLLAGEDDEAAAAAARVAIENGLLGSRWLFSADGTSEPTDELGNALDAIARSGNFVAPAGSKPADGLRLFLDHPEIRREQHCVIFAAARPGPWVAQVLAVCAEHGGTQSFILGTDGVTSASPTPLWRRLLFRPDGEPPTTARDLRTLLTTFERSQRAAMVVDRQSGRFHGSAMPTPGAALYRRAG